jgi:HSP20 family protein
MANLMKRASGGMGSVGAPDLRREIDRLFEDFFSPGELASSRGEFVPRLEIRESDDGYVMRAELPGMKPEQVELDVHNDVLTLRGERRNEDTREQRGYRYSECSYGSFSRSIQLPNGTDSSKIKAEFRDGMLEVQIPKAEAARPRRINVGGTAASSGAAKSVGATSEGGAQAQPQQPQGAATGSQQRPH